MTRNETVFKRGDGKWCAKFQRDDGTWMYLYSTKGKQVVRQKLRQAIIEYEAGLVPPSKMTLKIYLDEYLDVLRERVSDRTWLSRASIVRRHITPTLGNKALASLNSKDIHGLYRVKLSEGLAPSTVLRIHTILKQAMREAVHSKYIRSNPMEYVKPPRQQSRDIDVLTTDQVHRLLDAARSSRYEASIVLGATVGLRIGECLALRTEDVDLTNGTVTVRGTLWRGQVHPPKTRSAYRTIKLPERALSALTTACKGKSGYSSLQAVVLL